MYTYNIHVKSGRREKKWKQHDSLVVLTSIHGILMMPLKSWFFLPSSLAASFVSDQPFLTWLLQLVATVLCVCVSHDVTLNVPDRFACFNAPLLVVSPVASLSPSSFRAYFLCRAGKEQTPKTCCVISSTMNGIFARHHPPMPVECECVLWSQFEVIMVWGPPPISWMNIKADYSLFV